MKTRFELAVLQPTIEACHEKWEDMLPHEKGAFCLSCNKAVNDLSDLSSRELADFLLKNKNKPICGKITSDLLHQPIALLDKHQEKYSFNFLFALALFISFGPLLFSCNQEQHQQIKENIEQVLLDDVNEDTIQTEVQPEMINRPILKCGCEYEEEPEILLKDTGKMEIALDEIEIRYASDEEFTRWTVGAMAYTIVTYRSIEIDTTPVEPVIAEIEKDLPLLVYPNPARDQVMINYEIHEVGVALLSVFNINGQKITDLTSMSDAQPGSYSETLNVRDLPSGMYIIILINNQQKEVFRLSVTH